jgi:hypothetical protein
MRNPSADPLRRDIHMSSAVLTSMDAPYHKISASVKSNSVPTGSWSRNHTITPKERREKLWDSQPPTTLQVRTWNSQISLYLRNARIGCLIILTIAHPVQGAPHWFQPTLRPGFLRSSHDAPCTEVSPQWQPRVLVHSH